MLRSKQLLVALAVVGVAALLVLVEVVQISSRPIEKRSPPVTVVGVIRSVTYLDQAKGNLTVVPSSGCIDCPLVIQAGTSAGVPLFAGYANISRGLTAYFNWTLRSPYPFADMYCSPPIPSELFVCNETDQAGPYGGGSFEFTVVISIPYSYANLPASGNLSFDMTATLVGHPIG